MDDFSDQAYLATAHGQASGVFSVLLSGEGSITTHGVIAQGRLEPQNVTTDVSDDDGHNEVQMTFANGTLENVTRQGSPPKGERIEVTPDLLYNAPTACWFIILPARMI